MFVLLAKKLIKRAIEIDALTLLFCAFLAFQFTLAAIEIYRHYFP